MNSINFISLLIEPCEDIAVLKTVLFIKEMLEIVLYIIPIILILMIMLDLTKNVIANKDDEMRKNFQIAIKRIIYAVALFLVPTIVNFVIHGLGEFTSDYKTCLQVTKESIEEQIKENKKKCENEEGYEWDSGTNQCLIIPKIRK